MISSGELLGIPAIFSEKFPDDYVNDVMGWGNFSEDELHKKTERGIYKLKCLDIDFGIGCTLNCPHCFKRTYNVDFDTNNFLNLTDYLSFIVDAKELGLESIKIVGAGEPFENSELLLFLRKMTELGIHVSIFTKGHVLGNDSLAKKVYGEYGIETAEQLVIELFRLNTSILLGYNSYHKEVQGMYVGLQGKELDVFFKSREHALYLLCKAGFNDYHPGKPTRLALIAAPFKTEFLEEIFDIFKWARRRNIYTITCPTTESGDGRKEMERVSKQQTDKFENYRKAAIDFYIRIYDWSIEQGIVKLDDFIKDGVSLYPGAHVCNQTACGMYITFDGKVMQCPGFDNAVSLIDNDIRISGIRDAWINSPNYKRAEQEDRYNFECIARINTLKFNHKNFYNVVYKKVLERWSI